MRETITGVWPVLYAHWRPDLTLDPEGMAAQVEQAVSGGAHGVVVLGLVTEVGKLSTAERMGLVRLVGGLLRGRLPYAATVAEPTVGGQVAFSREARSAGADLVILQPPPGPGSDASLAAHFSAVIGAEGMPPCAVQNNPLNLAASLSPGGLAALARACPNLVALKAEGFSVDIARAVREAGVPLGVWGGHGGVEFPTMMRGGATGLIPAPDALAAQVRLYGLLRAGREAEAERLHRAILPIPTFMTRSIPGLVCYGKRFHARRLGLTRPVVDRPPFQAPDDFGLSELERLHALLDEAEATLPAA